MPMTAPELLPEITDSTRQALTLLLRHGPMARAELAGRLGLSPPALTKLTRPLLDIGVLIEVSNVARAAAGRPARPVAINPECGRFVGVKVTGDRLDGVLANLCGAVLRVRAAPLGLTDSDAVSESIVALVNEIADGAAVTGHRQRPAGGIDEVIHPSLAPVHLDVRELSFTDWARGAAVIAIQDYLTLRTH